MILDGIMEESLNVAQDLKKDEDKGEINRATATALVTHMSQAEARIKTEFTIIEAFSSISNTS